MTHATDCCFLHSDDTKHKFYSLYALQYYIYTPPKSISNISHSMKVLQVEGVVSTYCLENFSMARQSVFRIFIKDGTILPAHLNDWFDV